MAKKNEEKKAKKGKKTGKVILFLLLIIAILLAILYFGRGGFGFGTGNGDGSNDGEAVDAIATVTDEQTDAPEEIPEETTITVEINGNTVKFGSEEFADYESFEKYFYENKPEGKDYILKDNQAIKSVYDSVKSLLDSFSCTYSEEVV